MTDRDEMQLSLDRFEEGIAVLLTRDGQTWLVDSDCLPEDAAEGDILTVSFKRDVRAGAAQAERIRQLQRQLLDRTRERSEQS